MRGMEYRAYVRVPLDVEGESAGRLLSALSRQHGHLGPVLSGERDGLDVILLTDRGDRAAAAVETYDAVIDAMRASGMTDLYPTGICVEPVKDLIVT